MGPSSWCAPRGARFGAQQDTGWSAVNKARERAVVWADTFRKEDSHETPATNDWHDDTTPARGGRCGRPVRAPVRRLLGARPLPEPVPDARASRPGPAGRPG